MCLSRKKDLWLGPISSLEESIDTRESSLFARLTILMLAKARVSYMGPLNDATSHPRFHI